MRKSNLLFVLIFTLSLTSCYTTKTLHGNADEYSSDYEIGKYKDNILFWGLYNASNAENIARYTKNNKNYMIKSQNTFTDGLLSIITLGIYCPRTTTVYRYTPKRNTYKINSISDILKDNRGDKTE
ncbi:Bor/Iss family lipoprotein [Dysgonomonas capnocytophagoides]|uniref:Bor/Iss family lipoprotein n=1 Tax=Dysgonomonas capnocytophagoides TaxID=45254 RepID=UPI00041D663F|nr:hypothetical protein [Dysgonomonas capnocytophagoides]